MAETVTIPAYVFREGVEPPYFQVWDNDESSDVIHSRCAQTPYDREFPVYADEIQEMRCLEDIYCARCERLILVAVIPAVSDAAAPSEERQARK
ncbi:MAG TPA: hypothetical protein VFX97_16710 [Pyrinomonadaceae bacterium]|nr:hypothetical protein [Pyrinomonadaceae bacterium]